MATKPKVTLDKSHIVELFCQSTNYTVFDAKWVPTSARFIVAGNTPTKGTLRMFTMNGEGHRVTSISEAFHVETEFQLKCATFGAADPILRQPAVGDFGGNLIVFDLETQKPIFSQKIHGDIINGIDGAGAPGPAEFITGSRDGTVNVSDIRCESPVVASLVPDNKRDCWAVATGGTTGPDNRSVVAGFDNGEVKLWDIRAGSVSWETNIRNGVVSLDLGERTKPLKHLLCGCLTGSLVTFDLSEKIEGKGYRSHQQKSGKDASTVWVAKHLPQMPSIIATSGAGGEIVV